MLTDKEIKRSYDADRAAIKYNRFISATVNQKVIKALKNSIEKTENETVKKELFNTIERIKKHPLI